MYIKEIMATAKENFEIVKNEIHKRKKERKMKGSFLYFLLIIFVI